MRLLAGFWPFKGFGPSRTGAFVWRNRPDCPYAELGIDAILQRHGRGLQKAIGSALKTGSFVVNTSIKLTPKNLLRSLDVALKQS